MGQGGVVDEGVHLEVVFETAEVDVRGAHGAEQVVADQELAVQEAGAVEVDLDAGAQHVGHVGAGGQVDQARVALLGQHQADVDAGQGGRLQGAEDAVGGQEVGRLEEEVAAGGADGQGHGLHDGAPVAHGVAGGHLHEAVAHGGQGGEVDGRGEQGAVDEEPVAQEGGLQSVDGLALDAQVGVAPAAPGDAAHVALGQVHAAHEAHAAVHDQYLAVVAVVHAAGEQREAHLEEGAGVDAAHAHLFEEGVGDVPAAHVVVEHAHLDALGGLLEEGVAHEASHGVVGHDVGLQVDVVAGTADVGQHRLEQRVAVGVGVHAVATEGQGLVGEAEEPDQLLVPLRWLDGLLGVILHEGLLEQRVVALAADDAFAPLAASEEEVEDEPHVGQEQEDEHPGEGLHRVAVVEDEHDDGAQHDAEVDHVERGGQDLSE